jgi:hypothetical protein
MATWKIEPSYKKSVVERIHYYKGDKEIVEETGWRWGEFTCETEDDNPPVLEEGVDLYACDYDIQMEYCDDGCWTEYEFNGFTEEEQEEMEQWLEENSIFDLEGEGWICSDTEMIMSCEPSIEKIADGE